MNADFTVVGAGPAGLACAVSLAEAQPEARVVLLDEGAALGGQIWRRDVAPPRAVPPRERAWIERAQAAVARGTLDYRPRSAVVDASCDSDGPRVSIHPLERPSAPLQHLRSGALVLACGARERFLPFPGWTLPGVFGVGGLQALAKQGLAVAGKRVVLAGSGPLLLAVAADLRARGAEVGALVEQAPRRAVLGLGAAAMSQRSKRSQAASLATRLVGVTRLWATWPTLAIASPQGAAALAVIDARGRERRLSADLFGVGFGLVPEIRLARLLGCALAEPSSADSSSGVAVAVDSEQRTSVPGVFAVGEQCGVAGVDVALLEGCAAAQTLCGSPSPALQREVEHERRFAARLDQAYALRPELAKLASDATIVCRCEDVTYASLRRAAAVPGADARSLKLHTRCAMGPCQGRVCEPALEFLFGWQPSRCRGPLIPLPLSALSNTSPPQQT